MKKLFILFLMFSLSHSYGQDTLVKWTFKDSTIATAPYPNSGLAANLTLPIMTKGGTSAITYKTAGATTYCASATTWTSGSGVKYWQIKVVTKNYNTLKLSSKQKSSNTGPRDFKIQYMNGYAGTWTDVPSGTVLDSNNWTYGVTDNLALPVACENQDTVYLRWIMTSNTSANGSTVAAAGTSRMDDIWITGIYASGLPASKLNISSVNGGTDPYTNTGFYAVVNSLDASNNPVNVAADVNYTITLATGTGILGGTLTGTITAGTKTDTVFGMTYNTAETGVSIIATDNASVLTKDTSALFTVQALPATAVKLSITDVNGGIDPYVGHTFTAKIKTLDASDNPVVVISGVNITLSALYGTGILGGTLTGTIAAGSDSVIISGITYNVAENNIALKAVDNAASLTADTSALFNVLALPAAPALVITEIMYNPPESGTDSLEFIEIYNNGSTKVGLKNFTLAAVGTGTYTFKDDSVAAGHYYLLTVDSVKFTNFYGKIAHKWTFGGLSNSGKKLLLQDSYGTFVDSVHYLPSSPWPTAANGLGSSLTLCNVSLDNGLATSWQASAEAIDSVNHIMVRATPDTGCITTGIIEPITDNYTVNCYPNPVNGILNITTDRQAGEIIIYDLIGNIIFDTRKPSSVTTINTEKLNSGIYFIKVVFENNSTIIKKISVQ
jgi:hypothetical protein